MSLKHKQLVLLIFFIGAIAGLVDQKLGADEGTVDEFSQPSAQEHPVFEPPLPDAEPVPQNAATVPSDISAPAPIPSEWLPDANPPAPEEAVPPAIVTEAPAGPAESVSTPAQPENPLTVSETPPSASAQEDNSAAAAQAPYAKTESISWIDPRISVANGYRLDNFHKSLAGNSEGTDPDIAAESYYKDIDIYQVRTDAEFLINKAYVLKSRFDWGAVLGGDAKTSYYTGDSRYTETERLTGYMGGDDTMDASVGLGYELKPTKRIRLVPAVGLSYHQQKLHETDMREREPDPGVRLEQQAFLQRWWGPWAGGRLSYRINRGWEAYTDFEYHWGDFEADNGMALDPATMVSSKEEAYYYGVNGTVGLRYYYDKHWSAGLYMDWLSWTTHSGTHSESDGATRVDTRVNEVDWKSYAFMFSMNYRFDPDDFEDPDKAPLSKKEIQNLAKISGRYRLAAGMNAQGETILNDSNADLQERNWRYVYGERLNNTYDPMIFDQYLLNVDFAPLDRMNIYLQAVADPWSLVGTTDERTFYASDESVTARLKYFGAFNSTINETFRANDGNSLSFPVIKVHNGHTTRASVTGFDWGPTYDLPDMDINYEFRPIRKFWMDYTEDEWHARIFALADETQALTTDDPIGLSNHKDFWQQSPWLYQYKPIQYFSDGSVKRGYYSDELSFMARDSEGNRLVLLRGFSYEALFDKTYLAATVAAPYTPWDEKYWEPDNIPGAIRIKQWATDKLVVGGAYAFRTGMISQSVADFSQALGVDGRYHLNEHVDFFAEIAGSNNQRDLLTAESYGIDKEGYAYKAGVETKIDHKYDGRSEINLSFTQMDDHFDPVLSRFTNTRDDRFWGQHLTFSEYSPDMEYFRLGDGIDANRWVIRAQWKEKLFKDRFFNLFDVRNVHRTENSAYKETVLRDEMTFKINPKLTAKGMFRWQGLPKTSPNIEPFIASFYVADVRDPVYQNVDVQADKDPSRFTYSGGLQYVVDKQWTLEGIYERTNNISDFPRGLLNSAFRDTGDRVDGVLLDRITNLLYGQAALEAAPPYKYFNIFRERAIYKIQPNVKLTIHAAQNGYKFAGGVDDQLNHQGLSIEWGVLKKWTFFADYTHSMLYDLPLLVSSDYTVKHYRDHHNIYASADYKINSGTVFRAEYGVFGMGTGTPLVTPYSTTAFSLPTIDTEHLLRVSLTGDF